MKTLKRKIEVRAVNAVNNLIGKHPTFESFINTHDTEESYDGFIRLYLNNQTAKDKTNIDYDVPVQVKGHEKSTLDYMKQTRIKWGVNLSDLETYYRQNGCLYFVVFMLPGGDNCRVYYNSLYPSTIKRYLEEATRKGNKVSYNIPFSVFPNDSKIFSTILKQFAFETRKQGSGIGQIVRDSIGIKDLGSIKEFNATIVGGGFLSGIKNGDVVLYGKVGKVDYPLKLKLDKVIKKDYVKKTISINNKVFYPSFILKNTVFGMESNNYKDDHSVIELSENLSITINDSVVKYNLKFHSCISKIKNDAEFLIELERNSFFVVSEEKLSLKISFNSHERDKLMWFIDVGIALETININIDTPFCELSNKQINQLSFLRGIINGNINYDSKNILNTYDWMFGDLYYPILMKRNVLTNTTEVDSFIFNTKYKFSLFENDMPKGASSVGIVPNFYNTNSTVLANLMYYDYGSMREQIQQSTINDLTVPCLNETGLRLTAAFDLSGNKELLLLALFLFTRLYEYNASCIYLINICQVKKRLNGSIDELQLKELSSITLDNSNLDVSEFSLFCFCRHVLLGKKDDSIMAYDNLTIEQKQSIEKLPIFTLYESLIIVGK